MDIQIPRIPALTVLALVGATVFGNGYPYPDRQLGEEQIRYFLAGSRFVLGDTISVFIYVENNADEGFGLLWPLAHAVPYGASKRLPRGVPYPVGPELILWSATIGPKTNRLFTYSYSLRDIGIRKAGLYWLELNAVGPEPPDRVERFLLEIVNAPSTNAVAR